MTQSYLIGVYHGKGCYRHIRIAATDTLFDLHEAILNAFDFFDDHDHGFFMTDPSGAPGEAYVSGCEEIESVTQTTTLVEAGLKKDMRFRYIFDFDRNWVFRCRVLRELEEESLFAEVVRSVGDSPEQYRDDADFWRDEPEDGEDTDTNDFPEIYPPERLSQMMDELTLPPEVVGLLHDYFDAAARVYGAIPLEELLKLYNSQNEPISQEDFLAVAEVFRHADEVFCILGEEHLYEDAPVVEPIKREIISIPLLVVSAELYYLLKSRQEGKPYAVIPKEEFLKYADYNWIPVTPQSEEMKTFLKKLKLGRKTEEIFNTIHTMIGMDMSVDGVMEELGQRGFRLTSAGEMGEFTRLYVEMSNHTRLQSDCGHTPAEMRFTKSRTVKATLPGQDSFSK